MIRRIVLCGWAIAIIVSLVQLVSPGGLKLVKIEIYQSEGGPDITRKIQKIVGHMPGRIRSASPNLGRLFSLRPQNGTSNIYEVEPTHALHVYVIGESPEPLVFTFQADWRGHPPTIKIILDEVSG